MQSLCDLSHLVIIFQKAQSHISKVLFVAQIHIVWVKLRKHVDMHIQNMYYMHAHGTTVCN